MKGEVTPMTREEEFELFLQYARQVGNYHVMDFYKISWLPFKEKYFHESHNVENKKEVVK